MMYKCISLLQVAQTGMFACSVTANVTFCTWHRRLNWLVAIIISVQCFKPQWCFSIFQCLSLHNVRWIYFISPCRKCSDSDACKGMAKTMSKNLVHVILDLNTFWLKSGGNKWDTVEYYRRVAAVSHHPWIYEQDKKMKLSSRATCILPLSPQKLPQNCLGIHGICGHLPFSPLG